jgi:hypothetical protein
VRVCLAGGGREHVGYYLDEAQGAAAYQQALERIRQGQGASARSAKKRSAPAPAASPPVDAAEGRSASSGGSPRDGDAEAEAAAAAAEVEAGAEDSSRTGLAAGATPLAPEPSAAVA